MLACELLGGARLFDLLSRRTVGLLLTLGTILIYSLWLLVLR